MLIIEDYRESPRTLSKSPESLKEALNVSDEMGIRWEWEWGEAANVCPTHVIGRLRNHVYMIQVCSAYVITLSLPVIIDCCVCFRVGFFRVFDRHRNRGFGVVTGKWEPSRVSGFVASWRYPDITMTLS